MKRGCLSSAELQALLEDRLKPRQQGRSARHLEQCTECRERFEKLSAGIPDQAFLAACLNTPPASGSPALRQAIRQLTREENPFHTAPMEPGLQTMLEQFAPSEVRGHVGRFGPFEILELVNAGGMGVVWKALDTTLQRPVAIKMLAPALAAGAGPRARFLSEARAVAAIRHERVVSIYHVGATGGLPYLVMEYVPGETLEQRLRREGSMPLEDIPRLGVQIAEGLAAAHAQGIIHGDIKPANLLVDAATGDVKIADFGLARAVEEGGAGGSRLAGGTPEYIAPELVRGESIDERCDLFGLGCVLYALCTGRSPFCAPTLEEILRKVREHQPPPVRKVNPAARNQATKFLSSERFRCVERYRFDERQHHV